MRSSFLTRPRLLVILAALATLLVLLANPIAWSVVSSPIFVGKTLHPCLKISAVRVWDDFGEWPWSQSEAFQFKSECRIGVLLTDFKVVRTDTKGEAHEEAPDSRDSYMTLMHTERDKLFKDKFKYSSDGDDCTPPLKDNIPACKRLLIPHDYSLILIAGTDRPIILRGFLGDEIGPAQALVTGHITSNYEENFVQKSP